jgi:hypothetical protein
VASFHHSEWIIEGGIRNNDFNLTFMFYNINDQKWDWAWFIW